MCGGDITFNQGDTCGTCDYCGGTTTIPKVDDEQRLNRFNRANHFRRQGEFDKAIAAYEKILDEDDTDAEAHWGAVLSRYGIEYVEDPATKKRIPTCHRVQVESILADADYQSALKYAPDTLSRTLYEEQAKEIAGIQKGILAISASEKPYDVFICYKESDEEGKRTRDSALAQEVYYGLTEQGYKVFFSRITLEDKLGQEYEPYIFAALNSAKVMVVIGTKPEYFNAVWVKNEWSRYLHLMKNDRKRLLIPCYRDMDPYDLPDELSSLQSQDMSRIGFMQDLLRGIRKVLDAGKEKAEPAQQPVQPVVQQAVYEGNSNANALVDRAFLALEDGEFEKADDFCEQALNLDAKNSRAYLGKLMAERKVKKLELLLASSTPLEKSSNYQKAVRFASPELKKQLTEWNQTIIDRNETNRKARIKHDALLKLNAASTVQECDEASRALQSIAGFEGVKEGIAACEKKKLDIKEGIYNKGIYLARNGKWKEAISVFQLAGNYRDSREQIQKCEYAIRDDIYQKAGAKEKEGEWQQAIKLYDSIDDHRDSRERIQACNDAIAEAERIRKEQEEQKRLEKERKAKEAAAKKKRLTIIGIAAAIVAVAAILVVTKVIIPKGHYDKGISLTADGKWDEAVSEFEQAGDYSDAATQILATRYHEGEAKRSAGDWDGAVSAFEQAGDYSDAGTQIPETRYQQAKKLYDDGNYSDAYSAYKAIAGYKDVDTLLESDDNLHAAAAAAREAKLAPYKIVGGTVTFGCYEQDNDTSDGSEKIEWIVLDAQDGKSLLLSKYGLDAKPYNTGYKDITWEVSTIREWLNNGFMAAAFTAEEQKAIMTTQVDNGSAQGYSGWNTSGGNDTQDQFFLLSYAEANKYLDVTYDNSNNLKSRVSPTAYAKAQGAYTSNSYKTDDGNIAGWWWLRSPGFLQYSAADVRSGGSLRNCSVDDDHGCVRPAFWINLESDIF